MKPDTDVAGLVPCPFCGAPAKYHAGIMAHYVMCTKCEAMGPDKGAGWRKDGRPTIDAWNQRALTSTAQAAEMAREEIARAVYIETKLGGNEKGNLAHINAVFSSLHSGSNFWRDQCFAAADRILALSPAEGAPK